MNRSVKLVHEFFLTLNRYCA